MDFGLAVGVVIGLTRMSGGARTAPMLVIFFGVSTLTAVSCDLVTAAAKNPIRTAPPAVRVTVNWRFVRMAGARKGGW